jgi:multidrug efflux pump subunit AcrA (membrane-fusion protein)
MTANVNITLNARKGVLVVPTGAVSREQGLSVVYVLRGHQAARQTVKVGWRDRGRVEIVSGLGENDRVLVRKPPGPNGGGL